MAVAVPSREEGVAVPSPATAAEGAVLPADDVLARLASGTPGLPGDEAHGGCRWWARTRSARIGCMPCRGWPVSCVPAAHADGSDRMAVLDQIEITG